MIDLLVDHLSDHRTLEKIMLIMVTISRIEYQLLGVVLKKNECNSLMTGVNRLIKHSGSLASSTPNYILYGKERSL